MSKQVDERVVSLEFDNQNFESNVATSLNTLDKLKQKLNLPGATKGLEEVSRAASNVNLNSLASSVQSLESRFSMMGIAGATAISNITTKMMQFSSKTLNFLTNGIVQGGIARAMKVENARFQLQGLLKDSQAVDDVMVNVKASVDGTAYSMDAAASVASQLAASGMRAGEDMERSLKAVAGVAAMTNSSYEDIGRIFTQVAGQGKLMGDQLLQLSGRGMNAAATLADYLTKVGNGTTVTEAKVRDMVSKGKIDFQTFSKAMADAYSESAFKANETVNGTFSNIKAALAKIGESFVAPLVKSNGPLVNLLNAIREKINAFKNKIIGPLETAGNKVGGVINKIAGIIQGKGFSFSNTAWDQLSQKITEAGIPLDDFQNKFKEVAKQQGIDVDKLIEKTGSFGAALLKMKDPGKIAISTLKDLSKEYESNGISQEKLQEKLEYLQKMVDETWYGTWNNQPIRQKLMEQYGHNYQEIQDLVNKTVDKHRLTIDDLNESTLKNLGYTEDQIKVFKDLATEAKKTGTPINKLISSLNKPSKSFLVFDTLNNVVSGAKTLLTSFKDALNDAFTPLDGDPLWEVLNLLHDMSEAFVISDENASKLTRTFKGLFAAIDLVSLVMRNTVGAAFTVAKKVILGVMQALGFTCDSVLDFTAIIGDAIVKVRDWVNEHDVLGKALEATANAITTVVLKIVEFVKKIWEIPAVQNTVLGFFDKLQEGIKKAQEVFDKIEGPVKKFIDYMKLLADSDQLDWSTLKANFSLMMDEIAQSFGQKDWNSVGRNIAAGISEGIKNFATDAINTAVEMAKNLFNSVCAFFDIHSPSKKMEWVGEMTIQGFINGLRKNFNSISDVAKQIVDKVLEIFNSLTLNDVILGSSFAVGLIGFYKISKSLSTLMDTLVGPVKAFTGLIDSASGVLKGVKGVLTNVGNVLDAQASKIKSEAIMNIAKAIVALSGALIALSLVNPEKLAMACGALVTVTAALGGLAFATSKMNNLQDFGKISVFLISMGAALTLMASAIKKISKIDPERMIPSVAALGGLIVAIGLIAIGLSQLGRNEYSAEFDKAGNMMLKMGITIKLMASAIKSLAKLDTQSMLTATAVVAGLTTFLGLIAIAFGRLDRSVVDFDAAGNMLLKMSAAMLILALSVKLIAGISEDNCKKGIAVIGAISALFVAYNAAMSKLYTVQDTGSMLLKMSVAIGILALTIKLIARLSESDIKKGVAVIGAFMVFSTLLVTASYFAGSQAAKAGVMLLGVSVAIGILAIVIKMIGKMDAGIIVKGYVVISAFSMFCAILIAVSKFAGQNAAQAGRMLLGVAATIGILVIVIRLISDLDNSAIVKGIAVIAACSVMFALLIQASQFAGQHAAQAGKMLMMMTVPIIALAAAIGILSMLDTKKVLAASAAMTMIMGMFAVIAKTASVAPKGLVGLLAVSLVVAELAAILYLLSDLKPENALAVSASMSLLMLSLSATMAVMSLVGNGATKAIPALVAASAVMVVVAALLGALEKLDVVPSMETVVTVSALMLALSAVCLVMAGLGMVAAPAMVGITAFIAIIGELAIMLTAIGALTTLIPQLQDFLDNGITVLEKIGTALGTFFGNIVGGFLSGASSGLPEVGTNLSQFMTNAKGFFDGLNELDPNLGSNVEMLSKALLMLTGSGLVNGLVEKFTGLNGLDEMAENMPKLGKALVEFSDTVKGDKLDSEAIQNATTALQAFAQLSGSINGLDLIIEKFTGKGKLDDFGSQLGSLADGLVNFQTNLGDTPLDTAKIETATNALQSLAQLSGSLNSFDSVVEWITGKEGKLANFGSQLGSLGDGLKTYCEAISGTEFDTDKINTSIEAAKALSQLSSCTSTFDQVIEWITGKGKLETFATQLSQFGKALKNYCKIISDGKFDVDKVNQSTAAATAIGQMVNNLPSSDSKTLSLVQFGGQIETFGTKLATYCSSIADTDFSKVADSANAVESLGKALQSMSKVDSNAAKTFADSVNALAGANVKGFVSAFEGVDSSQLASVGKTMMSGIASGISSGASAITSAIKKVMNSAASSAKGNTSAFTAAGKACAKALSTGIKSGQSGAKTAAETMARSAANSAKGQASKFNSAGAACAEGFAAGIRSGSNAAITAAVDMAASAYAAAKKKLDVNSPSKLFRRMAICVPEGFAQGIVRGTKYVVAAAQSMADTSITTTENALNKITMLNLDSINTNPTITPVVDLTNVNAGADKIASLLNLNPSLNMASNLGAINSAFTSRIQNDSNLDVVNAIKDLKRTVTKAAKPTYNINGITYDDGSNVSQAVGDLVRAVKIEGRV